MSRTQASQAEQRQSQGMTQPGALSRTKHVAGLLFSETASSQARDPCPGRSPGISRDREGLVPVGRSSTGYCDGERYQQSGGSGFGVRGEAPGETSGAVRAWLGHELPPKRGAALVPDGARALAVSREVGHLSDGRVLWGGPSAGPDGPWMLLRPSAPKRLRRAPRAPVAGVIEFLRQSLALSRAVASPPIVE
jgi:hypothetical protein